MFVVVGAGVAGLTAARVLFKARVPFLVFERDDGPGGRVRTDVTHDGFRLDRGFQTLFTRYPAVRRYVDLKQLGPRIIGAGAVIMGPDGRRDELDDPIRVPGKVWKTLRSPVLTLADKGRVALEAADLRLRMAEGIWTDRDTTTHAYLRQRGFSQEAIERFFRPFFGGLFLDRSLSTSSNAFRFAYKMLAEGDRAVPALGMGEIARQLAAPLPPSALRYRCAVEEVLRADGRVVGVRAAGTETRADAVIVCAEGPAAARLADLPVPVEGAGVTTLYFAGTSPVTGEKRLFLNAAPTAYVNEAVQISNVAPEYAPPGEHLLSATVLGVRGEEDAEVERRARAELAGWFGDGVMAAQRLISLSRIRFGQFPQPAGFTVSLPPVRTGVAGLYNGGEAARASSINGAMEAGEAAALAALEDVK
jgi:phytoene dehydrogenase-like protein